jgi:tetratricopeptide (TPR) repeat protein
MRWAVLMAACLLLHAAAAWGQGPVTLISVQGDASVRRSGAGAYMPAARKMTVAAGDIVRTGATGRLTILFADGSQIKLNRNTLLLIPSTPPGAGIPARIGLSAGEIWARVTRGRRVRFEAQTAVAAVRGTDLHLSLDPDGTVTLTVAEGQVAFSNPHGSVLVRDAQQSVARPGRAPTAPITVNVPFIIEWTNDVQPVALLLEVAFVSQDPARLSAALREAEALPEGLERSLRLGDVRHDRGELQAALDAYEAALRALSAPGAAVPVAAVSAVEQPNVPLLQARIGQTLLELGRLPEAEAAFRRSLEALPDDVRPRAGLVITLLSRRQSDAALVEARTAVARDERSPLAHTALALAHLRRGEMTAAKAALGRALALDAEYAPALAWQSFVLRAEGRLEEANAAARRAVSRAPHSSLARQSLADLAFALGRTEEARREATRAVALNPLSPGARVSLGRALLHTGQVDRAAQEAGKAVALDPDLDRARFFYGLVLAEQRRLDRAVRELREALARDPDHLEARALLARVLLEQGRRAEAVAVAREAVTRDPAFAPARGALGRVYWRAGRLSDAVGEYREALRLAPESALYRIELARVFLDQNNLPDALANGLAAVSAAPRSGEALALLGLIYDRMDNREQALQRYREAISLAPENALARLGFGLRNPSSQDGLREIAQAMLRDPSVLQLIFKPGVTTEVAPSVGSHGRVSLDLAHRDSAAQGALHDLTFASREWRENERDGRGEATAFALANVAAASGYQTNLLGQYLHLGDDSALPGPTFDPDRDARRASWTNGGNVSFRHRLDPLTRAWMSLTRTLLNARRENPDAPADGEALAFDRTRFSQLSIEARLDRRWNERHATTYLFAAGRDHTQNRDREYDPLATAFANSRRFVRTEIVSHVLQHDFRPGNRFSLILGTVAERFSQRARAIFEDGSTLPLPERSNTRWLPYGEAAWAFSARDTLRLIGNRRQSRRFEPVLQPGEALLVSEIPSLAADGSTTNWELDFERRFSPRSFGKLFLYRSDVDAFRVQPERGQTLRLTGFTVPEARVEGFGARYEQQIGRFLSGYLRYTYAGTTDESTQTTRGRQLPFSPRSRLLAGLNFIDRAGTKLFMEARWNSRIFVDPVWSDREEFDPLAPRPTFPAKWVLDLRLAREPSVRQEWVFRINNLLNTGTIYWPGFPRPGRTFLVQYRRRF